MMKQFINRKAELKFLEDEYKKAGPRFVVIYGRRRIGKTELIKHFIAGKPHVYFLADERTEKYNIMEIQSLFASHIRDSLFAKAVISSWDELFKEAMKRVKKRLIIVIDEFPYIIRSSRANVSVFQKIWDNILSERDVFLILLGSSIRMMEDEVLDVKSPLYGRRTGQWKIEPMKLRHLHLFLPDYSFADIIKTYGVTDGIPQYLLQFSSDMSFTENLQTNVMRNGAFLFEEAEILLKEEMREPSNYYNILRAIAFGRNRFGEIANFTQLDKSMVSKYIENLIKIHVIKKEFPVTLKKETRNAHYVFSDNYFMFWFRFIYPNKSMITGDMQHILMKNLSGGMNLYFSVVFEKAASETLAELNRTGDIQFAFTKIGRWWHRDSEIDLVALNEQTREIMFAECKWKENVNAEAVYRQLKEKAASVEWNNGRRKEHYAIFAKSFRRKLKMSRLMLFDLHDMDNILRRKS